MAHPFETALAADWQPSKWREMGVLVAVSGGPDSVALLRGLEAIGGAAARLTVAHFNHRLRPDAADDADLVARLAAGLGLEFAIGSGDAAATAQADGDGIEAAARAERYRFLQATAERIGARYVAAAHTADDQAETILHRIVRGTGIAGLIGMRRVRPLGKAVSLVRPMLSIRRTDVLAYLDHLGQPYRDDPSNSSPAYTRNRIRRSLLPSIEADYNPEAREALLRLAAAAGDAQRVIDRLVEQCIERAIKPAGENRVTIDCDRLAGDDRHLVRELFVAIWRRQGWPQQAMSFAHWDRLADMVVVASDRGPSAAAKRQTFPGAIVAERRSNGLRLSKTAEANVG